MGNYEKKVIQCRHCLLFLGEHEISAENNRSSGWPEVSFDIIAQYSDSVSWSIKRTGSTEATTAIQLKYRKI